MCSFQLPKLLPWVSEQLSRYSDVLQGGRPGFDSQKGKIFLFSTPSKPAVAHPRSYAMQRLLRAISPGAKEAGT
jgi:hypothetical protein